MRAAARMRATCASILFRELCARGRAVFTQLFRAAEKKQKSLGRGPRSQSGPVCAVRPIKKRKTLKSRAKKTDGQDEYHTRSGVLTTRHEHASALSFSRYSPISVSRTEPSAATRMRLW